MTRLIFLSFIFYVLPSLFVSPVYAQRGLEFLGVGQSTSPGELFERLFFFGLGLVGLAALIVLVFGGIMYLTAGDSADQTKRARGYMYNAIFGLALAFLSWLILFTINPDIVQVLDLNLKDITLQPDIQFRSFTKEQFVNSPSTTQFEKDIKNIVSKESDKGLPILQFDISKQTLFEKKSTVLAQFKNCGNSADFMTNISPSNSHSLGPQNFQCNKCENGKAEGQISPIVRNDFGFAGFACKQ